MNVTLKELQNKAWCDVWCGVIDVSQDTSNEIALNKAFDAALLNYIGACFPEGFGLRTDTVFPTDPKRASRILHCSGRNVKIRYDDSGMHMQDNSVQDRVFMIEIER